MHEIFSIKNSKLLKRKSGNKILTNKESSPFKAQDCIWECILETFDESRQLKTRKESFARSRKTYLLFVESCTLGRGTKSTISSSFGISACSCRISAENFLSASDVARAHRTCDFAKMCKLRSRQSFLYSARSNIRAGFFLNRTYRDQHI